MRSVFFLKLEESINHVERTYEEVKRDAVLSNMLREARESRPPFVLTAKIPKERSAFFGSSLGNLLSHYEGRCARKKEFFEGDGEKNEKNDWRNDTVRRLCDRVRGG